MNPLAGEPGSKWPQENFWLNAGWLIDGMGGPAAPSCFIRVQGGLIRGVSTKPPESLDAPLIDLSHATVVPMLMDAHVHLALSGTPDALRRQRQLAFKPSTVNKNVARHLSKHWSHGVSAVREAGDPKGLVWEALRGDVAKKGPPVVTAITRWAWHAPGRYGAAIGQRLGSGMDLSAAAAVHFPVMDHVKIIQSGINSIDRFGFQSPPQFDEQALNRLVAQAHHHRVKVMVHANGKAAVRMALGAGCDSIEHGYFMGASNLRCMADRAITWVPTLIPMAVLVRSRRLTVRQRHTAKKTLAHQMAQIHLARQYGVQIGLGTDAGSWGVDHGKAVHKELALLISAGLSPEQAVSCATFINGQLLGRHRSGALIAGQHADFLVIPDEPQRLVQGLSRIMAKCWRGQWQIGPSRPGKALKQPLV